jgi:peptidoglycan/LPS O-acetylase OafA/YrhL
LTKRLDIQILRGLAVIGVVLNHVTTRLPGGFIGVDIFFVISGFLIAQMFRGQVRPLSFSDYQNYIARRLLRLFPALIFVSVVICVATIFLNNPSGAQQNAAKTAISTNLFFGNLVIQSIQSNYFANNALYNPLMHFWTLSVEWQFYLIYPVALILTKRLIGRSRGKFGIALIFVLVTSLYFSILFSLPFAGGEYFLIRFRIWEFLIGVMICILPRKSLPSSGFRSLLQVGLFLTLIFCMFTIDQYSKLPGPVLFIPTLATGLLIYIGPQDHLLANSFSRIMAHIGDLSYSLYLWHWPVYIFLEYLIPNSILNNLYYFTLIYVLSFLTFKFIESPYRVYRGSKKQASIFIAKLSLLNILVAASVGLISSEYLRNQVNSERIPTSVSGEIYNFDRQDEVNLGKCTFFGLALMYSKECLILDVNGEVITDSPNMIVVGDSHARHLIPGLISEFPEFNVVFIASTGFHKDSRETLFSLREILSKTRDSDFAVLSSFWDEFGVSNDFQDFIADISSFKASVFIDTGTPKFSFSSFRCKYGISIFLASRLCENSSSFSLGENMRRDLEELVDDYLGVTLLNSHEAFCRNNSCSMLRDNEILFYDNNHLNSRGSVYLIQYLRAKYPDFSSQIT